MALVVDPSLKDFTKKFAPVPPKDDFSWQDILFDLISDATPMVGGKFFKYVLQKLPGIASLGDEGKSKAEEITQGILGKAVEVGTSLVSTEDPDDWSDDDQDAFMTYLGQSAGLWDRANTMGLATLFDGSDDSIKTLKSLVADGHFINGASDLSDGDGFDGKTGNDTVTDAFAKALYGYAIPVLWQASGHHPFIIDTQRSCTSDSDGDDEKLATACYGGKLYKLADPDGESRSCRENAQTGVKCGQHDGTYNDFATLSGVDELKDGAWGGVTPRDIIVGAVRTYIDNGEENGSEKTVDRSKNFDSLVELDITVPQFINLPVCTETVARRSWTNSDDTPSVRNVDYFPCNIANGKDYCGESTFEDQGSEASPLIEDCKQIIKNIQGTDGEWNTSPLEKQRALVSYGSCKFGVTGKGIHGNDSFMTGAQDIIDIINDAIEKFGRDDGRVGAKGTMQCDGNIKKQKVDWGLY
ncbi:putative necrosis-inducing factor-domain-containing protein [Aspergillus nidulans var. acristatus]